METSYYRRSIGDFECISVGDGIVNYPIESFFANASRLDVEAALRQHGLRTDQVATPYTCLFVNTGQHHVMIDLGAGSLGVHAGQIFPGLDHTTSSTGSLIQNLRAAGISPDVVDTVIITHAHPDHVGGALDDSGNLIFANANYYIGRTEWNYWMSEEAADSAIPMAALVRRNLAPLRDRMILIEDGHEIVPGIRAIATPGHTAGHMALSITSGGEELLHVSDVVLFPLHLEHPDWLPVFDLSPAQAAASKQSIFDYAAEKQALVFAHHFPPFPNLGHVIKRTLGWQWQPIKSERGWTS
jgi:glyoxylase-like metal-dependent hydrolase (beta-lactamase superfamily II)